MAPKIKSTPKRLIGLLAATAVASLIPLGGQAAAPESSPMFAPTQAHAGLLCDLSLGEVCGTIYNSSKSNVSINVHDGWGPNDWTVGGRVQRVMPGKKSTFRDADGYCIPPHSVAEARFVSFTGNKVKTLKYKSKSIWQCQKVADDMIVDVLVTDTIPSLVAKREAALKAQAKKIRAYQIKTCKVMVKKAKSSKTYAKKNKKALSYCSSKFGIRVKK